MEPILIIPKVANNMTGTAVVTSIVVDVRYLIAGSMQAIWTGTPTGTFDVQGSLDYKKEYTGAVSNPGTWDSLGITIAAPAGAAGSDLIDLAATGVPWLRLVYTNVSGTGTLVAYSNAKASSKG